MSLQPEPFRHMCSSRSCKPGSVWKHFVSTISFPQRAWTWEDTSGPFPKGCGPLVQRRVEPVDHVPLNLVEEPRICSVRVGIASPAPGSAARRNSENINSQAMVPPRGFADRHEFQDAGLLQVAQKLLQPSSHSLGSPTPAGFHNSRTFLPQPLPTA